MIISSELTAAFESAKPILEQLRFSVDELLTSLAGSLGGEAGKARVKPIESVAAKIEKDSVRSPFTEMEDLVAATVALPTREGMDVFERRILQYCEIIDKKGEREVEPEKFLYDDRHLILRFNADYYSVIDNPLLGKFKFEVQLKTHLQYALSKWSRGSYKASRLSWGLTRLISQTRALVEMADTVLANLEASAAVESSNVIDYKPYALRNKIIEILQRCLLPEQLPEDMRRLAITVEQDMKTAFKESSADERIEQLERLLIDSSNKDLTSAPSLTAYNVVFMVLFRSGRIINRKQDGQIELVKGTRKSLLVTREMLPYCPELANLAPEYKVDLTLPT